MALNTGLMIDANCEEINSMNENMKILVLLGYSPIRAKCTLYLRTNVIAMRTCRLHGLWWCAYPTKLPNTGGLPPSVPVILPVTRVTSSYGVYIASLSIS